MVRSKNKNALTLLEVAISIALLILILLPLYLLMMRSRQAVGQSSHYRVARTAVESVVERLRFQANSADTGPNSFERLVQDWGAATASAAPWTNALIIHPAGLVNNDRQAPGNRFWVRGLPKRFVGGTETPHGEIVFPSTVAYPGTATDLDEANALGTGVALDLDGSGATNTIPVSGPTSKFRCVPVTVRVFWGRETTPKYQVNTIISKRANYLRDSES